MKNTKHFLLTFALVAINFTTFAQVAIGTTSPDTSAVLALESTSKGILVPRMTTVQRGAINNPSTGLLVFDTNTISFWFYNGSGSWQNIQSGVQSINDMSDANADNVSLFLGNNSGGNDDGSNYNTGIGISSLDENTSGYNNTASGYFSLSSNTTGKDNTASGYSSLSENTTGDYNTAYGSFSLNSNTIGNSNTSIGYSSFSDGNLYSNSTGIGFDAEPGDSNTIRLGNSSVITIGGYQNWTNAVSDGRFKTKVNENVIGLDFIMQLRPVTYNLDMDAIAKFNNTPDNMRLRESESLKAAELQSGFIAQEVEAAANAVKYDFHGVEKPKNKNSHYGLRYSEFVVPLVKGMQEQKEIIEALQAQNEELQAKVNEMDVLKAVNEKQQAEIDNIKAMLGMDNEIVKK